MNINAESIQKKEFHVVFKGYKPEEVDKFLDILTVEFDKLQRSQKELQENIERLKYEGNKESGEMKKVIQEALVSAHKIAEDIKQKAELEAEELIRTKVAEQEKSYKDLLSRKAELERDIKELSVKYEDFKDKIEKLVEDLKKNTSKLGEGISLNIPEIGKKDLDTNTTDADEYVRENKKSTYLSEKGLNILENIRENKRTEIEEEKEIEEETDKEEEKEEEGGADIEKKEQSEIYQSEEKEEMDYDYKPRRMKKKIDIANPDIINDFFKTDED
ncbi:MAG: DivIVA domain-containing protein [Actinomycetota bacterium]|nr:DivIVA domain-containing protein [Actinomycetota bacterium]